VFRELKIRLRTAELASPIHAVYQMCARMRHKKNCFIICFHREEVVYASRVDVFSEHVSHHLMCISCTYCTHRCAQIFRRHRNHLKFLGAIGLIQSTIHIEDPKILGAARGFVHPNVCVRFVFLCVEDFKYLGAKLRNKTLH
jgi:ferredoxin